jgi:hypothetical protein
MLSPKKVMTHLIPPPTWLLDECYNVLAYLKRVNIAEWQYKS